MTSVKAVSHLQYPVTLTARVQHLNIHITTFCPGPLCPRPFFRGFLFTFNSINFHLHSNIENNKTSRM